MYSARLRRHCVWLPEMSVLSVFVMDGCLGDLLFYFASMDVVV